MLISLAPMLLLVVLWVFIARRMRGALGGGAGGMLGRKAPPKPVELEAGEPRTTFADVAGIDEVEGELSDVVDFLKNPDAYRRMGAKMPRRRPPVRPARHREDAPRARGRRRGGRAVLLGVRLEFIEMIVGVGASRVRELFAEARKVAPSIIFIDEIDTIGRTAAAAPAWAATTSASRP